MPKKRQKKEEVLVPVLQQVVDPFLDMKTALESGLQSPFWQVLKRVIDDNVVFLSSKIEQNVDDVDDKQLRLLVKWRNLNKELSMLPESLLRSLQLAGETKKETTQLDPYFKTFEEIMNPNV